MCVSLTGMLLAVAVIAGFETACSGCGSSTSWIDAGLRDGARDVPTASDHPADGFETGIDAGPMPVMLYQDQGGPNDLALDETYVYWASYASGLIQRMPKEGGEVQVLAQVARMEGPEIDVDDTNVYFVVGDNGGHTYLAFVPKAGGPVTNIVTDKAANAHDVFAHGGYLYWLTGTDLVAGILARAPIAGGATQVLGSGYVGTGTVVADDQYIYWSTLGDLTAGQGQVLRLSTAGTGSVETLVSNLDTPWRLTLDASRLFVGVGSVTRVQNNVFNGQIIAMDKATTAPAHPSAVIDNQSGLRALAVDDTFVYWIASVPHDGIYKAPKTGGGPAITLATGQALPVDIAVDDRYVFWINTGVPNGAVMRLAK